MSSKVAVVEAQSRTRMMTKNKFISKWKIHFLFGGVFLAAVAFSVVTNIVGGQRFFEATWSAVRELKPIEVGMLISFWYACVFYPLKDEWNGSFTTLNLKRNTRQLDSRGCGLSQPIARQRDKRRGL